MTTILLFRNSAEGKQFGRMLAAEGVEQCRLVTTIENAAAAARRAPGRVCIFFERSFAEDYRSFFHCFENPYIRYGAVCDHRDDMDCIEAINSGRVMAYLIKPLQQEKVQQAVENIEFSFTPRGHFYLGRDDSTKTRECALSAQPQKGQVI